MSLSSRIGGFRRRLPRNLLGSSSNEQWGTKIIAGEQVAAAAMLPFVRKGPNEYSPAEHIAAGIQYKNPQEFVAAAEAFPGSVQDAALEQLGLAVEAGFTRLLGRVLGV